MDNWYKIKGTGSPHANDCCKNITHLTPLFLRKKRKRKGESSEKQKELFMWNFAQHNVSHIWNIPNLFHHEHKIHLFLFKLPAIKLSL